MLFFIFPEFWLCSSSLFPFCVILSPFVFDLIRTSIIHFIGCFLYTIIRTPFGSGYFFLNLRAKSFWDSKYLSTISCAELVLPCAELTTELFLLNNSPLFDIADVLSQLFFALFPSDMAVPILTWLSPEGRAVNRGPVDCAALSSRLRTLSFLCRFLSLFFFTFGMIPPCVDYYHTHLDTRSLYKPMYIDLTRFFTFWSRKMAKRHL